MIAGLNGMVSLSAIARASEALADFAEGLRSESAVVEMRRGVDIREYRTGAMVEMFVDAELSCGLGLVWWLDITWGDEWTIRPTVRLSTSEGEECVSLAERFAVDDVEMASELAGAVRDLLATKMSIDLGDPSPFFR